MKLREHSPGRRQLDRVDIGAWRVQERPETLCGKAEAMLFPAVPWLLAKVCCAAGEVFHRVRLSFRYLGQAGCGYHENASIGGHVIAAEHSVLGVVEPHDQGSDARPHHGAAWLEAGDKVAECVAATND